MDAPRQKVRLNWAFLGRVDYRQALDLQTEQAKRVAGGDDPFLFMLEHPPTITLGRQADPGNLLLPEQEYGRRGIGLERVLRGGDVTYHGPGQLVGYPVASLAQAGCGPADWVAGIARAIVDYLCDLGLDASWSAEKPGVWVGQEKIAALGFRLSHRISTHGFALNLDPDLRAYETIVPCGLTRCGVTSLAQRGLPVPSLEQAAQELTERIAARFNWQLSPGREPMAVMAEKAVEHAPLS